MDKAAQRQQEIAAMREKAIKTYPHLWESMINEWRQPGGQNCAWLMYSANYLFRTGNIRWALDPFTLQARVPQASAVPIEQDLDILDVVLLTHRHADHLDLDLIRRLINFPIQWVIPKAILPYVLENTGLSIEKVIIPRAEKSFIVRGIEVLPFDSMHWEWEPWATGRSASNAAKGLPETGYRITVAGKKWLFPGDIRTYDPLLLPLLGSIDVVFAHLWLGRNQALKDNPSMLNKFCRFYLHLKPRQVIVTHLDEFGRAAKSLWTESHYQMVKKMILALRSDIKIIPAHIGDKILL